jgi:hypothetical protein
MTRGTGNDLKNKGDPMNRQTIADLQTRLKQLMQLSVECQIDALLAVPDDS